MKKTLLTILLAMLFVAPVLADNFGLSYHQIQVWDELDRRVAITSVSIYAPGTTTDAVIYARRNKTNVITIPLTTTSDNTTLNSTGFFTWWGPDQYDFTITDGTDTFSSGGRSLGGNIGKLIFPLFLKDISSTSYEDDESITMGTNSDWVINAGTVANTITFTPAVDNSNFIIGLSGTAKNSDFNVYIGTLLGLKVDAGVPSFVWDGGAATLNHNSNFNTGINTGTSTGAMTFGSSTAGTLTIDSTSTGTINTDGSLDITTTDASADITIDSTLGSVLIDSGEAADPAITIVTTGAAGSIDITSLADIDITTTGAAGEDITLNNQGGSINIIATENATDTLNIDVTGGIDIDVTGGSGKDISIVNTGGSILITSTEAQPNAIRLFANNAEGGITINSGAEIVMTAAGKAGDDIGIANTGGSVIITATEDIADSIVMTGTGGVDITATGAAAKDLDLVCTSGSANLSGGEAIANAVVISAPAGGVDISAAATFDIDITATGGTVKVIASEESVADQFKVDARGAIAGDAINFETTDGGIMLNADGGSNGDIELNAASVITLVAADAAGILATTATFEHKAKYFPISAGFSTATECIVGGGTGLTCSGLNTGADEIGSTEGFVQVDDETDTTVFSFPLPDDFVDTGTQADLIITFDIAEQAGEECNIDVLFYEYDGAANTTAIITDTIVIADSAGRGLKPLVTNAAGIGNEADLNGGDHIIVHITSTAAADDFNLYGFKLSYRVGLQPTE